MGSEVFSGAFSELQLLRIPASESVVLRDALMMSLVEWDQFVNLVKESHLLDLDDPEISGHTQFLVQYAVARALSNQLKVQVKQIFQARGRQARDLIKKLVRDLIEFVKAERAKLKGKAGGGRPKRGDHVINNGVLNVYHDIFSRFVQGNLAEIPPGLSESEEFRDILKPLPDRVTKNIQDVMVVHFTEGRPDIDINDALYGTAIENLRKSAVLHMKELYGNWSRFPNGGSRYTSSVREWTNQMNGDNRPSPIYVDEAARDKWVRENARGRENIYEPALIAVGVMFQNLYEKLNLWTRVVYRYAHPT